MNESPPSLDRLHDLAVPPNVPWWPLAPGWQVVLALLALALLWGARAGWKRWRAQAYRRAALRELDGANDLTAIAEILRRTALEAAPRQVVTRMAGADWIAWLEQRSPEPLSPNVCNMLTTGIYGRPGATPDIGELRRFAALWIRQHRTSPIEES